MVPVTHSQCVNMNIAALPKARRQPLIEMEDNFEQDTVTFLPKNYHFSSFHTLHRNFSSTSHSKALSIKVKSIKEPHGQGYISSIYQWLQQFAWLWVDAHGFQVEVKCIKKSRTLNPRVSDRKLPYFSIFFEEVLPKKKLACQAFPDSRMLKQGAFCRYFEQI